MNIRLEDSDHPTGGWIGWLQKLKFKNRKQKQKLNRDNPQGYFNKVGLQSGLGHRLKLSNYRIQYFVSLIKMNFYNLSELAYSRDLKYLNQPLDLSMEELWPHTSA